MKGEHFVVLKKCFLLILIILYYSGCSYQSDGLNPNDQSGSATIKQTVDTQGKASFSIVLQGAASKSFIELYELKIIEAVIGLITPSGENLITNWRNGDDTSIHFSGMDFGSYTLNLSEINLSNETNNSGYNFNIQKGYDYDIIINLGGNITVSIGTNDTNTVTNNDSPIITNDTNYVYLDAYQSRIAGKWTGYVTTPWVNPYQVEVTFYPNGCYSGIALSGTSNIGSIKLTNCPSFYYGSDDDSILKVFTIDSISNGDGYPANTAGYGSLSVLSSSNSTAKGSLRVIEFSANFNHLEFEFWHRNRYGPIKLRLDRMIDMTNT